MGINSKSQKINDAYFARSMVENAFEFSCNRTGFKVSLDKDNENVLVTLPKQKRPSVKITVKEAMGMTGSQRNEWCRSISRSIDAT